MQRLDSGLLTGTRLLILILVDVKILIVKVFEVLGDFIRLHCYAGSATALLGRPVSRVPTIVLQGVGPEVLGEGDGELLTIGEDLSVLEVIRIVVLIVIVIVVIVLDGFALLDLGPALFLLLDGLLGLLSRNAASTVAEKGEEAGASRALRVLVVLVTLLSSSGLSLKLTNLVDELLELRQLLAVTTLLLLGFRKVASSIQQTLGQVLALLPVDANRLRNQTFPGASLALGGLGDLCAPVKVLDELLVLEEGILLAGLELEGETQAARLTLALLIDLEPLNGQVLERGAEDGSVGGHDILIDLGGGVGEHTDPEVILDLGGGDELVALLVQGLQEGDGLADCFRSIVSYRYPA